MKGARGRGFSSNPYIGRASVWCRTMAELEARDCRAWLSNAVSFHLDFASEDKAVAAARECFRYCEAYAWATRGQLPSTVRGVREEPIANDDPLEPTAEEREALEYYAATHGRTWRSQLLAEWTNGRSTGILQVIRNSRGPSWLIQHYKPRPARSAFPPSAVRRFNNRHED